MKRIIINIIRSVIYILLIKVVFILLTKVLFTTKVEGKENLQKKKPFIIVANHTSFADAPVIELSVPVMIRWVTRQDIYDVWFLKPLHKFFGSIVANGSVEKALAALRQNDVVGIFPEGARTPDGKLKQGSVGVAVMALKSGVPVVPVAISGAFKAMPRYARLPRFHHILVKIGHPLIFAKTDKDIIEQDVLRKTTDIIMSRINELLVDI